MWDKDIVLRCDEVPALYVGGAQNDVACLLSALTMMVHNILLYVLMGLHGFTYIPTLCTTSMVHSYIGHHRPVLSTTDLHCAP